MEPLAGGNSSPVKRVVETNDEVARGTDAYHQSGRVPRVRGPSVPRRTPHPPLTDRGPAGGRRASDAGGRALADGASLRLRRLAVSNLSAPAERRGRRRRV